MLSIKANFNQLLKDLAITPYIYHGELPQNPNYPATVYDLISDVTINHTHDHLVPGFRQARFQIDVFAETVAAAEDAMERYYAALVGYKGSLGDGQSPGTFKDVSIFDAGANPDLDFEAESTLRMIEGRSRDFYVLY